MDEPKTVLLGVTGGITAYKACEILRGLQGAGIRVRVMMTEAATRFVGPVTFEALSRNPVYVDGSPMRADSTITYTEEAREADLLLIAPATANTLAKMAQGLADNILTATYLAFEGPVVVAPSMNVNMWEHPATRHNLAILQERGVIVVPPGSGELACGVKGSGRMSEPAAVVAEVELRLQRPRVVDLGGLNVLVTAGGTQEPIDAVRYIGNRSSGKMGHALARAAYGRGAGVTLVQANVSLPAVPGVDEVRVTTADEMYREVTGRLEQVDILIMAAAVADYRVAVEAEAGKISKKQEHLSIDLEPTTDILCEVAAARGQTGAERFVVGFAAEYGLEGLERARRKLRAKDLDMIVFNDISRSDIGFNADENEVVVLTRNAEVNIPRAPKGLVAELILDEVVKTLPVRGLAARGQPAWAVSPGS